MRDLVTGGATLGRKEFGDGCLVAVGTESGRWVCGGVECAAGRDGL